MNATRQLKSRSSSDHDEIASTLQKDTIINTHIPLTHIVKLFFSTGIMPNRMKNAKVIPIFKASDPQTIPIYRSISVPKSFSKQEHPRGSIVEPQGVHKYDLNSLSYNGLKTTIFIAHVYAIFLLQKKRH